MTQEARGLEGEPFEPDSLYYVFLCIQKVCPVSPYVMPFVSTVSVGSLVCISWFLFLVFVQYMFENGRVDDIFSDQYYSRFCQCLHKILEEWRPSVHPLGKKYVCVFKWSTLESCGVYVDCHCICQAILSQVMWPRRCYGSVSSWELILHPLFSLHWCTSTPSEPPFILNSLKIVAVSAPGFKMLPLHRYFHLTTVEQHMKVAFSKVLRHTKKNPTNPKDKSTSIRYLKGVGPHHVGQKG